jgi:hypothetical protein
MIISDLSSHLLCQEYAFESREFLRALAVGKEVTFTSTYSLSSSEDNTRDIGTVEIGGQDLALDMLRSGWAKLKELKREATEEDLKKREAESEAKAAGKGLWNPHGQKVSSVSRSRDIHAKRASLRLALSITRCLLIHKSLFLNGKENQSKVSFCTFLLMCFMLTPPFCSYY